jgi:hypothetical protein
MPNRIQIRDVVRNTTLERGPDEAVLRVPYELFQPVGAVQKHGELVDWTQGGVNHTGRTVSAMLKDTHPGERVLMRLDDRSSDEEWWLYEVVAVDGVAGSKDA